MVDKLCSFYEPQGQERLLEVPSVSPSFMHVLGSRHSSMWDNGRDALNRPVVVGQKDSSS